MTPTESFSVQALAIWSDEDQVWYPHVRWLLNDKFFSERQYIIGFEDSATAATFARTFQTEEIKAFRRMFRLIREDVDKKRPAFLGGAL